MAYVQLVRVLARIAFVAAAVALATGAPWGALGLAGLAVLVAGTAAVLGRAGAWWLVTGLGALVRTDVGAEGAFVSLALPSYAALAAACLLACVVLRFPSLGREIEHGIGGP